MILNGAARKNGNTAELIKAFSEGAATNVNIIREFYIQDKTIHGCIGCNSCRENEGNCVQKDDMEEIYDGFEWSDVVVFASPIYFTTITGTLKTVNDRLYAMWNKLGHAGIRKRSVLLLTAATLMFEQPLLWYQQFIQYNGWKDLGIVLGAGNAYGIGKANDSKSVLEARKIGESIQ